MLEEKLDLLTKETVALRKAIEANTAAQGATASGKKTTPADDAEEPKKARGGRKAKDETPAPEHDKDEVEAIIRRVSKEVGKPVAVKLIKSFKGVDDLAELLTHPEHFDAAFAKAKEALGEDGDDGDDGDGDGDDL